MTWSHPKAGGQAWVADGDRGQCHHLETLGPEPLGPWESLLALCTGNGWEAAGVFLGGSRAGKEGAGRGWELLVAPGHSGVSSIHPSLSQAHGDTALRGVLCHSGCGSGAAGGQHPPKTAGMEELRVLSPPGDTGGCFIAPP